MSDQAVQRVRHREKQVVKAEDLTAEQGYHIGMRRRHLVGLHRWGIVGGLELSITEAGRLQIASGLAVDGYGRLLDVPQNWLVERAVLDREPFSSGTIDVWLLYARIPETPFLAEHRVQQRGEHRRWREMAHIRLQAATAELPDPYAAPIGADPCQPYGPHLEPPDDPADEWPVYLGRVNVEGDLKIDQTAKLPYVWLNTARVYPPTRQVELRTGGRSAADKHRFAISLHDENENTWREQFTIDDGGATRFKACTTISPQEIKPFVTALAQAARLEFKALPAVPENASPWSLYRVQYKEAGQTINELRCEIGLPEDAPNPAQYQFQLGIWEDGAFRPKLIVSADGTVTINGDIDGTISKSPIPPDLDEPDFVGAIVNESHNAMMYSAAKLDPTLAGLVELDVDMLSQVVPGHAHGVGIVITNTGQSPVSAITLYVRTTLGGNQLDFQVIDSGFNMLAGQVKEYLTSIPISAEVDVDENLEVEVKAAGKGPMFNIVENNHIAIVKTIANSGPQ
ncbi:MAG: hypothetical protein R3293_06765 [Candidatus Promineifilaceae bacterium]|nr:hypothetical protein [Candidatus Promineifilaceae bacterium]